MLLADFLAGLGVLCLITTVSFVVFLWWDCHCQVVEERRRAQLRADWSAGLPERRS